MKTALLTIAIAAGLTMTAAQAGGPRSGMMQRDNMMQGGRMPFDFATLDADGDGLVTPAEVEAAAAARFAAADTDGDGGFSVEEMTAQAQAMQAARVQDRLAQRLARMDDNGDDVLQLDEIEARAPRTAWLFDRVDADNDGAISAEEMAAARTRMSERMERGGRDGYGDRHGDRNERGGRGDAHGRDGNGHGPRHRG